MMAKQRGATNSKNTLWRGFLPPRTLIMGRKRTPSPSSCSVCTEHATQMVSEGNPLAELLFISTEPVSGTAGELLGKMIEAMGLKREQTYLVHVANCPSCGAFLSKHLDQLNAKVIVALGEAATQTLMQNKSSLAQLRGNFHLYRGVRLMPTFHPSDLLAHPASKRETWSDLLAVARELGLKIPSKTAKKE